MHVLGGLVLILLTTLLLMAVSRRLNIPLVIGELLAGVLLGPGILGWVHTNSLLETGAELGVIVLIFLAGMESDLTQLRKYFRPAMLVATLGVIVPMLVFTGFGLLLHKGIEYSLFLGVVFAATSVSISVEVLREMKKLDGREGTIILGAAVVDDILAVLLLSIFVSTFGDMGGGQQPTSLWLTLLTQAGFFIVVFILVSWLAPRWLHFAERLAVPYATAIAGVIICFSMAYLADLTGLSAVIGAYFAGIAIGQTKYATKLEEQISPVGYTFLIPIFFVSIGLVMDPKALFTAFWLVLALTILAIVTKLFGAGLGARLFGMSNSSSLAIGSGMVSRGEMALVIAQIGFNAHLVNTDGYSEVIIVVIISTLVAPFLLKWAFNRLDRTAL